MPLPKITLVAHRAPDELAREAAKQTLLGAEPEQAAAAVGAPVELVRDNPAAQALVAAVEPDEKQLLQATAADDYATARRALESREGRAAWLAGVMTGELKIVGAFGNKKEFPPAARIAAASLLGKMYADFTTKHEVTVTEEKVFVFAIPDNGRLPDDNVVDALPEDISSEVH